MKYKIKISATVLTVLMVLSLLSACGSEKAMTLRVCVAGVPGTLDPVRITTDSEKILVDHLLENLMKVSNDGSGGTKAIPGQAQSFELTDNLDGTETYTFKLRGSASWSDGQKVTAHDFEYAWKRLADPVTGSPHAEVLRMVAGFDDARSNNDMSLLQVTALSDTELQVNLAYRCPYFIDSICTSPYTMPVRGDAVSGATGDWSAENFLTNGPYTLTDRSEEQMAASVSENYYDTKKLGPSELRFIFAADSDGAMQLYKENEVDFLWPLPESETTALAKDGLWTADGYASVYTLLFNQMSVSVQNESLRHAMSLTVDRNAVVSLLGAATHQAAGGLIPSGVKDPSDASDYRKSCGDLLDNNPENYAKNCEMARHLMADAGFDAPQEISVDYVYADTAANQQVAELLRKTWLEQLELSVRLHPVSEAGLAEALGSGEFVLAGLSLTTMRDDATGFLDRWNTGDASNYGFFSNSAYDMLLRVIRASSKADARSAYLKDAEGLLLETAQVIPLYFDATAYKLRDGLEGVFHDGLGNYYFTSVNRVTK
ncbi:MAG: peptide ABC transporter substrate-binding protein [Clostridiales bacterium]|nr:peptide ABC transporter substrate-binding protein [Clostridiales bacterium]